MSFTLINRKTINKPGKLPHIQIQNLFPRLRPPELPLLKPLLPQTKPVPIPVQNLYDILPPVAECKKMPRKRIQIHVLLD